MESLPLEGLRILDMTMWWSGPLCTSYFGAQGAEVIKIESIQSPDGFRYTSSKPGENWWELGPQFNSANMNKLGLTLNLNEAKGKRLFKELVAKSDVVIENFSSRVIEKFGLTYDVLKEINPKLIMISMPAYGKTGPFRDQPGFAYTFEILSGLAQLNGYENENPMIISGVGDVISGFHSSYALLAALEHREDTGEGQFVEVAQVETAINYMGQPFADLSMNDRKWGREGNRHPEFAPHGFYRSKGEDSWIAIAITNENEWVSFCKIMDREDLAKDSRFDNMKQRYKNQEELDKIVEEWTAKYAHYEATNILQEVGIKSGPVLEVDEIVEDPFLNGMFQEVTRDLTGTHEFPTWPVKFSGERLQHQSPAPKLGEHNEHVLKDLLGYSEDEIEELRSKEIIGEIPLGAINN